MENEKDRKERVTVRIDEGPAENTTAAAPPQEPETNVVFFRDPSSYFRGYRDGSGAIWLLYAAIFLLSFSVALLVMNASE